MVLRGIKGVQVNTNGSLNSLLSNGWCTRKGASAEFSAYSTSLSMVTAQWLIDLGPTGSYDSVALLLSTLCCTQAVSLVFDGRFFEQYCQHSMNHNVLARIQHLQMLWWCQGYVQVGWCVLFRVMYSCPTAVGGIMVCWCYGAVQYLCNCRSILDSVSVVWTLLAGRQLVLCTRLEVGVFFLTMIAAQ